MFNKSYSERDLKNRCEKRENGEQKMLKEQRGEH